MQFKKGDKVNVLDEAVRGVVVAVASGKVQVLTEDGFTIPYATTDLVKIENEKNLADFSSSSLKEILGQKETPKRKTNSALSKKEKSVPPMEVDLHINQLVANTGNLDNYDMLNIQVDTAKRQLEFAMTKGIRRVVFIHGVGEGVLKTELEYLFRRYDNVKFYDADYQKYGRGATEVYILQNVRT